MRKANGWLVALLSALMVLTGCEVADNAAESPYQQSNNATTEDNNPTAESRDERPAPAPAADEPTEETSSEAAAEPSETAGAAADEAMTVADEPEPAPWETDPDIQKIIALIHEATDNLYKSSSYSFLPSKIDEETVQVEVHRTAPDSESHANLVGLFRYDKQAETLQEQDTITGQWQDVTPAQ